MKRFYLFFFLIASITIFSVEAEVPRPPNIFYTNFFVEEGALKVSLYWYRDPPTPTSDITRFNVYRANSITEDLSEFTFLEEVVSSDTSIRTTIVIPSEGNYTFYVTAINGEGESEHSNFRNINAELKITFNTSPIEKTILPNTYSYDADASYSLGGEVNYELTEAPSGMSVNETSGLVSWVPTTAGTYNIELKAYLVSEPSRFALQTWTLAVDVSGRTLAFVTTPPPTGETGTEYYYNAEVECTGCLSEDRFRFFLLEAPSGMIVNADEGTISWTPDSPGTFNVKLRVMVAGDSIAKMDQNWSIEVTGSERILRVFGYLFERDSTIISRKNSNEQLLKNNPIKGATLTIEFYDENHNLLDTHSTLTDASGYFDLRWAETHDDIAVSRGLFLPKFTFPVDSSTHKAKYKWFYKSKDGNGTQDPWMAVVVVFTSEDEEEDLGNNYADPETDEPLLNLRVYGKITYADKKISDKKGADIPLFAETPALGVKMEVEFYDENYNLLNIHSSMTDGNGDYDIRWAEDHDGIDVSRGLFIAKITIPASSGIQTDRWFYLDKNGDPTQDSRCASDDDIVFLYPEYNPVMFNVSGLDSETEVILNLVSGVVVNANNENVPADVFLMKYDPEKFTYYDYLSQTNASETKFVFESLETGRYILRVRPFDPNYASTYYSENGEQVNIWEKASVLTINENTNLTSIKIILTALSRTSGTGKISGKVKTGKNKTFVAGLIDDEFDAIGGANVLLFNLSNTIIHDFTSTTNKGEFHLDNIAAGTYQLVFDRAPYKPMNSTVTVDLDSLADASVIFDEIVSVDEPLIISGNLQISPQPASESFKITLNDCNGFSNCFLYDSKMNQVNQFNINCDSLIKESINCSDLPSGLYLLIIQNGINIYSKQLLIVK